jgi:hypothetical protein
MQETAWDYRVVTFKIAQVREIEDALCELGEADWELVSVSTTVKTWLNVSGNDMVGIFKRPDGTVGNLARERPRAAASTEHIGWM